MGCRMTRKKATDQYAAEKSIVRPVVKFSPVDRSRHTHTV